jgi:hypothetical protein
MCIHQIRLSFTDFALAGLDDLDDLVALRVKDTHRSAIGLIDAGTAHKGDEHVFLAIDGMPHDVFADLLALCIEALIAVDDRRPGRITGQTDFRQAAAGIQPS